MKGRRGVLGVRGELTVLGIEGGGGGARRSSDGISWSASDSTWMLEGEGSLRPNSSKAFAMAFTLAPEVRGGISEVRASGNSWGERRKR